MDDLWVVLPHLGAGGAQKVGLLAAEHFAAQGFKVRVLSLRPEHPVKHRLPDNVSMLNMDPDPKNLHPWLRDVENRSWPARGRRFSVAQLIKVRRWILRFVTVVLLRGIQLALPWFDDRLQPGRSGLATALLSCCMDSVGGLRYARLRELLVHIMGA